MYLLRNIANSLSADNLTSIASKGIDILNTPIEHLMEVLSEMEENIQNKEEKNYYRQKLNDLRNVVDKNDNLVRLLSNSNMQVTINNILSSSEMLDGSGLAKSIKDSLKKDKEKQKDIESKIDKLLSHMDSEDDTNNYYIEMANSINSYLNDAKNKCIDANEMKSLIRASKNMAFAINMTKQKSYDIPMVINDDVTNVHLTIIDKHSPNSRISINYTSEQLGHTNIEFSIKNDVIDGYIISDNPDMINALKNNNSNLENDLTSYNLRVKQIAYGTKKSLNYDYIFNDNNVEAKNSNKQLYSISKMLITNIKNIHNNLTKI